MAERRDPASTHRIRRGERGQLLKRTRWASVYDDWSWTNWWDWHAKHVYLLAALFRLETAQSALDFLDGGGVAPLPLFKGHGDGIQSDSKQQPGRLFNARREEVTLRNGGEGHSWCGLNHSQSPNHQAGIQSHRCRRFSSWQKPEWDMLLNFSVVTDWHGECRRTMAPTPAAASLLVGGRLVLGVEEERHAKDCRADLTRRCMDKLAQAAPQKMARQLRLLARLLLR